MRQLMLRLRDSTADVQVAGWQRCGYTALAWAAMAGQAHAVAQLVDAGADVNARNQVRWSAPLLPARRARPYYSSPLAVL